jgi:hypothetical protein
MVNKLIYIFLPSLPRLVRRYQFLLLLVFCSLLYLATSFWYVQSASPPSGDEPHYLVISQTLLKYHSLDVMRDYTNGDYRSFYPMTIDPHVTHNERGQLLPIHAIGGPILWLLPYYFWGRLGAVLCMTVVSLLVIYNIYALLVTMQIRKRYALLVSLAFALGSPLYIYAHLLFIEPFAALAGVYVLRKVFAHRITFVDGTLSSILLGLLPWIHIRFALVEAPLFFAFLYRLYLQNKLGNLKQYICYLLPVTVLLLLFELYNYKVWGTLSPAANELNDNDKPFVLLPFIPLLGISFDQEYGLLINFPLFVFFLSGIVLTWKKKFMAYHVLMLIVSVPYILVFTTFRNWSGGWCPPARLILVLLPMYAFYIAYALEQMENILAHFVFMLLTLYGFAYNLLSLSPPLRGFNSGSGRNQTIMDIQVFSHSITSYLPSVFLPHQTRLFMLWIGVFAAIALLLIYSAKFSQPSELKAR